MSRRHRLHRLSDYLNDEVVSGFVAFDDINDILYLTFTHTIPPESGCCEISNIYSQGHAP